MPKHFSRICYSYVVTELYIAIASYIANKVNLDYSYCRGLEVIGVGITLCIQQPLILTLAYGIPI